MRFTTFMTAINRWQKLSFSLPNSEEPQASELLESLGALSITLLEGESQPIFELQPGDELSWISPVIEALFTMEADMQIAIALLSASLTVDPGAFAVEILSGDNWERRWLDYFKPTRYGDKLWICPTEQQCPGDERYTISMDPGLAFGTGSHETTELCLKWLDQNPPLELDVIDYGCGSGILALAALKLGATHARAVDIDPAAVTATENNATVNQLSDQITISLCEQLQSDPCDLLLANILANPLHGLIDTFARLVKTQGTLVLSGLLIEQMESITAAYSAEFVTTRSVQLNDWGLIELKKK